MTQKMALRRFAAVVCNPLKSLVRRFFAAVLRRLRRLYVSHCFYWCGGPAAVCGQIPPYPPISLDPFLGGLRDRKSRSFSARARDGFFFTSESSETDRMTTKRLTIQQLMENAALRNSPWKGRKMVPGTVKDIIDEALRCAERNGYELRRVEDKAA